MSARDVFIELKERGSSARTGREQEPRCFELGGSKMEMADARLDGAFRERLPVVGDFLGRNSVIQYDKAITHGHQYPIWNLKQPKNTPGEHT